MRKFKDDLPWWLRKLHLVRDEVRSMHFPRTAEEGLRQTAELSAASMEMFKDEISEALGTRDVGAVERETRRLITRFSRMDERWEAFRKEARATPKR